MEVYCDISCGFPSFIILSAHPEHNLDKCKGEIMLNIGEFLGGLFERLVLSFFICLSGLLRII